MKDMVADYNQEFQDLVGDLSQTVNQLDPMAAGALLYTIAQEKKNTNLIVRDLNAKFDTVLTKINQLDQKIEKLEQNPSNPNITERDEQVLAYVREKGSVCAETIQEKFQYKGRNAAASRLSNLYQKGLLEKTQKGRKVYYQTKTNT
ncbi:MAG: hypothetical protein GF334_12170 [Candidatus Altiarchaeales archaeon]|nr:hypothetical protein [Candidatus Altiarchaeales archaeon]